MNKISNENYVNIQGWMVNELKLKGNELLIYAIIYGFSQDGISEFNGGLKYLMDWTSGTKKTCINNLQSLMKKGLIIPKEYLKNKVRYVSYIINTEYGVKNIPSDGVKKLIGGVKSIPKNKYNNKNNIIYNQRKYKDLNKYYNNI